MMTPEALTQSLDRALCGVSAKEFSKYRVSRVLAWACGDRDAAGGLEKEVHEELSRDFGGRHSEGRIIPFAALVPQTRGLRDMQVGVFGQGGATVATEVGDPIPLLRNRIVAARLGATLMVGLRNSLSLPRQTAAGTAYSVTEIAPVTASNLSLDSVSLSPKRITVQMRYSRQLVLQSSIAIEEFLRADMLKQIGIAVDRLALNGAGGNSEPLGIMQTPGIGQVPFGGAATYAKLVSFEGALASMNADAGKLAFATTPASKAKLKSAAKLLVGANVVASVPCWEDADWHDDSGDGRVAGYRAAASNQVPGDQMLFGNWADVVVAVWGNGVDVIFDPYSLSSQGEVVLTASMFFDVGILHPQSFCVSTDSAAQ